MRTLILTALFSSLALQVSFGGQFPDTIELEDGTVYEEVRLVSQTPSEIVIIHSGGGANLEITQLSLELQRDLGYSSEKAEAYEVKKAEAVTERRDKAEAAEQSRRDAKALEKYIKANTFMLRGTIWRITPEGILLDPVEPVNMSYFGIALSKAEEENTPFRYKRYRGSRPQREFGSLFLTGHPRQANLSDGESIDVNAYRKSTEKIGETTAKRYVFLQEFE